MHVIRHDDECVDKHLRVKIAERLDQRLYPLAKRIQHTTFADNRPKLAFILGNLEGDEKPPVTVIDITVTKLRSPILSVNDWHYSNRISFI